jgi:DNA-binding XRE family transcriptional regulator
MRTDIRPNRLREMRQKAGLAQDDLAQKVGVRALTISRIERGLYQPRLETAQALARELKTSIEKLFPEQAA